jgi:hypothetical protein
LQRLVTLYCKQKEKTMSNKLEVEVIKGSWSLLKWLLLLGALFAAGALIYNIVLAPLWQKPYQQAPATLDDFNFEFIAHGFFLFFCLQYKVTRRCKQTRLVIEKT